MDLSIRRGGICCPAILYCDPPRADLFAYCGSRPGPAGRWIPLLLRRFREREDAETTVDEDPPELRQGFVGSEDRGRRSAHREQRVDDEPWLPRLVVRRSFSLQRFPHDRDRIDNCDASYVGRELSRSADLRARLEELAAEPCRLSFRRLAVLLRRDGLLVNIKRVLPVYREAPESPGFTRIGGGMWESRNDRRGAG
jgi:hypothetical protein